jgi:hypothetical protein
MRIDIEKIIEEVTPLMKKMRKDETTQMMLQGVKGQEDPYYGCHHFKDLKHIEFEFREELYPDLYYTNSVVKDHKIHRTRLMRLLPQTCYTYHKDFSQRVHIPLITNENCFIILDDVLNRYPADGSSYLINTTKMHTALNASNEERWHIVGCTSKRV